MNIPTISVCASVNTEEKRIKEFITSLYDFADEIIISDTGSLDRTIQLVKEFIQNGYEKVSLYNYKSPGMFHIGEAKNFAMSKATKDYILVLDADERLSTGFKENIKSFLLKNKPKVIQIVRQDDLLTGFKEQIERITKNGCGVFHGTDNDSIVHEHFIHNFPVLTFPFPVWHCQREKHWLLKPHSRFYYLSLEIDRTPKTKSFIGHVLRGVWKFQYKFRKIYFGRKMRRENEGLRYALFRALYDFMIEFFVGLKRGDYKYWDNDYYREMIGSNQKVNV
jgi:glycosyltransferase involved in cell wall biosynthesis